MGEIGCLLADGIVITRTKRVVYAVLSLRLDTLKEAGGCQSRFNAVAGWSRSDARPLMESSMKLTERRLAQSECLGERWQALFLVSIREHRIDRERCHCHKDIPGLSAFLSSAISPIKSFTKIQAQIRFNKPFNNHANARNETKGSGRGCASY